MVVSGLVLGDGQPILESGIRVANYQAASLIAFSHSVFVLAGQYG